MRTAGCLPSAWQAQRPWLTQQALRDAPIAETLVTEAFAGEMRACHAIIDEGLADPDPWHGFCLVIEKTSELHARNRGFTAAFASAFPNAMDFAADRLLRSRPPGASPHSRSRHSKPPRRPRRCRQSHDWRPRH
jgi:hypothetical protein